MHPNQFVDPSQPPIASGGLLPRGVCRRRASALGRPGLRGSSLRVWILMLALPFAVSVGCAEFWSGGVAEYSTTAKGNFDRANEQLNKKNYPEAIRLYTYVKSKFTFSKYATLAELRIADANFGRDKYQDAVDGYRSFIKSHPTHENVVDGYADFRIGESYHKEIPSSWFLVPPSYEKDQGPVRDALRELAAFIIAYPSSPHIAKAKSLEEDCVKRLADHELYVARFYLKKKKLVAATGRLEGLLAGTFLPKLATESRGEASSRLGTVAGEFLKKHLEPEVLLLLGETYAKAGRTDEARRTFERLIEQHPNDLHAKKARADLDALARLPPPAPAPAAEAPVAAPGDGGTAAEAPAAAAK